MHRFTPTAIAARIRGFVAIARCARRGENPFEVLPLGPCTRMSGDRLVDGEEMPRWMVEMRGAR